MIRYIGDMIFMVVVWVILLYSLFKGDIAWGHFIIGTTLSYVGARVLFLSDFILELLETRLEIVKEDE